jgi:hypothetical protein
MKALFRTALALAAAAGSAGAATTINPANYAAYGANIGWINFRGDVVNGAVIGEYVCTGAVYAANCGWIDLGNGAPVNGIRYQNNAANDYGVNHDGFGRLYGFAYGANIGWVTFTDRTSGGASFDGPRVDLLTGRLSGWVYSANCGWISLNNAQAYVQTDTIRSGSDSDGDGIADAWERTFFGNLAAANASSDADGDGQSDRLEYLADTNPLDPASNLRITYYVASSGGSPATITWTSRESRYYYLRRVTDVPQWPPWPDSGLGLITPDAGASTTRGFVDPASPRRFFQVEAVRPLTP